MLCYTTLNYYICRCRATVK